MKDILDEESRKALIAYRMQRAYDTMKEAEVRFGKLSIMLLLTECITHAIMRR